MRVLGGCLVALTTLSLLGLAAPAMAQAERVEGGSGSLVGREETLRFEDDPPPAPPICLGVVEAAFEFGGVGSYQGMTERGELAVYRAEVGEGEAVHDAGPLRVSVRSTEEYYMAPEGTYGNRLPHPRGCDRDTYAEEGAVPATFTVYAEDRVHAGDEPCTGEGHWWREHSTFFAEWTLDSDCTIEGNELGSLGAGVAPAGTVHTAEGDFDPCWEGPCPDNVRANFEQDLSGEASAEQRGPAGDVSRAPRGEDDPALASVPAVSGAGLAQALLVSAVVVLVTARTRRIRATPDRARSLVDQARSVVDEARALVVGRR